MAQEVETSFGMLGAFLVANGLASSLSAGVWGRMSDASSRQVLIRAALLASLLGPVVIAIDRWA
ncbi:MAG TPA: MFS transporter, partial [Pseudomonas sp.]|nr:MFS transporter [Pseudomonas sp.]